ncbi:MAG: DEAD/DEAH box helicase [Candidatus Omnitrophica bacterium]|nr:DEAD/DEAH box helicase [Candidatus Omnitrophota bacterium]
MTFSSLGLAQDLIDAIRVAGYEVPSFVQEKAIPIILRGRDLIVQAKTGTGKTASFALPVLQLVKGPVSGDKRVIKGLVLAPSRELAMQVERALKAYGRQLAKPLRTIALIGGLNVDLQIRNLHHGADLAVATPGRLLDLVSRAAIDLSYVKFLVVDEADKMFDLGFVEELEAVLKVLPANRQNLLFSATITEKVIRLTQKFMVDPVRITEEEGSASAELVNQRAITVNRNNRGPLLRHLIRTEQWPQVLVFVSSVRDADMLVVKLLKAGIEADAFHGGLTQAQRVRVLHDFKDKKFRIMVSTDLAARGIDIHKLPYVVNYDLPRSADDYIHRMGRTARAGEKGTVVSFIGHEDQSHFSLIEKKTRIRLPRESIEGFLLTGAPMLKEKGNMPVKGHRMSKKDKARALALRGENKLL